MGVKFKIVGDREGAGVVLSAVGCGYTNVNKTAT
jgi:hypothetical protein